MCCAGSHLPVMSFDSTALISVDWSEHYQVDRCTRLTVIVNYSLGPLVMDATTLLRSADKELTITMVLHAAEHSLTYCWYTADDLQKYCESQLLQ